MSTVVDSFIQRTPKVDSTRQIRGSPNSVSPQCIFVCTVTNARGKRGLSEIEPYLLPIDFFGLTGLCMHVIKIEIQGEICHF